MPSTNMLRRSPLMNGSVPSRWSRLIRILRPTAVVFTLLFVLQSCGGNPKPNTTPQPDKAGSQPAPSKPVKSEPAPAPAPAPTPAPAPAPAPSPVASAPPPAPPAPVVKDSAAIAAQFCQQIMTDVLAMIKDTTQTTQTADSIIQKVANGLPDSLTSVAM